MNKKILGAVLSSLIFIVIYLVYAIWICYCQFFEDDRMPWILFFILLLFFVVPILGLVINLINRIREIKGGEEDEASKY